MYIFSEEKMYSGLYNHEIVYDMYKQILMLNACFLEPGYMSTKGYITIIRLVTACLLYRYL